MNTHDILNTWFLLSHETRPAGILASRIHSHQSYELFIIINGSTTMLLDDKFISASKYDVVLLKPSVLHKNNGGTVHNRYAIHFTKDYLDTFFTEAASHYIVTAFNNSKLTVTEKAFNSILELLKRCEKDEEHAYIHIAEVMSILNDSDNTVQSHPVYPNITVNRITEYIHSNYSDITSLDDIAGNLHITKPYMCHIFKKETNVTVSDYLNRIRIHNACDLLRKGNTNITETALLCGYNSPMYFCKIFKRIMNETPLSYKNKFR